MILAIKIKPNSKESKIEEKKDIFYIYTKSPAKENKANFEMIDLLSEYFNISKKDIHIKKGVKSKHKLIEIVE